MQAAYARNFADAATVHCPQCGRRMRVAPQHLSLSVACPHCAQVLEPWRIMPTQPAAPTSPPPVPFHVQGQRGDEPIVYSDRNRWIAGALGILLGVFGVHRFYLGQVGLGVTQLVLGILSFGIISSIWGFIDGILCFCGVIYDADGLPLRG